MQGAYSLRKDSTSLEPANVTKVINPIRTPANGLNGKQYESKTSLENASRIKLNHQPH